ncbi:MAG: CHC2 zinc finger domain-containing protein [Gallionella sp.]
MSAFDNSQYHKAKLAEALRNARHAQAQRQAKTQPAPAPRRAAFSSRLDKARLPAPAQYYAGQGLALKGGGAWRDAVCPFHTDTKPSLRVRIDNGAFSCMVCGAHGGDVLAFHMQRHGLAFSAAAIQLGAWKGAAK